MNVLEEELVDQAQRQCLTVDKGASQNSKLFDFLELRPELNLAHYWFQELKLLAEIAHSSIHCFRKALAQHLAPLAAIKAAANHQDHLTSHLRLALLESEAKDHWVRKYHRLGRLRHLLRDSHQRVLLPLQNQLRGRIGGPSCSRMSSILECRCDLCRDQMERSCANWCTCTHHTSYSNPKLIFWLYYEKIRIGAYLVM